MIAKQLSTLLFIYSILGYIVHLSRQFTTDGIVGRRREIANYGLGVLSVLPLATYMFDLLEKEIPGATLRFIVAFLLSFTGFGIGVVVGHRYDTT